MKFYHKGNQIKLVRLILGGDQVACRVLDPEIKKYGSVVWVSRRALLNEEGQVPYPVELKKEIESDD